RKRLPIANSANTSGDKQIPKLLHGPRSPRASSSGLVAENAARVRSEEVLYPHSRPQLKAVSDLVLDPLNPEQRAAVTHREGPLLILAGAGSGKTRVLTHRIAYLIREGVPARSILAVTFTNKAAREMRERLDRLLDRERVGELTVGTFHGFCARLLRHDGPIVGVDRAFAIYDEADQRALLRQAMADQGVPEKMIPPGAIAAAISGAKNELHGPADMAASAKSQLERVTALVWP